MGYFANHIFTRRMLCSAHLLAITVTDSHSDESTVEKVAKIDIARSLSSSMISPAEVSKS